MKYTSFRLFLTGVLLSTFTSLSAQLNEEMRDQIHEYGTKGYYYTKSGINLDSAEYYLTLALELQKKHYDTIDDRVATNHILLASVYGSFFDYDKAIYHLSEAETILKAYNSNDILLGNLYHNKGNLYLLTNDFYRTKEYYEYALNFLANNGYKASTNFAHVFSNYIDLLFDLEENELAEDQLSMIDFQSLNASPPIEARFHLTNATTYSKLDQYESAEYHFNEAHRILQNEKNSELNIDRIVYYYSKIDFHILYMEYDSALAESERAFSFIETLDPLSTRNKPIYHSNIIYRTSTIKYRQGDYKRALDLTTIGIDNLNNFLESLSISESVVSEKNVYSTILPQLSILKSRILYSLYNNSNSITNLKASYDAYEFTIQTLNLLKLSMQNEASKMYATSRIVEVYNEAIYVGKILYELTGEIKYLEKSFEFAESSKSFALYSEIKNVEAIEFSGLPSEVKDKEERYIRDIQVFEEALYQEQLNSEPDSNKIELFKERLFHLDDDYSDLLDEIERDYADYYELKYTAKFISLEEVMKKLPNSDALIEYVLTDSMLITFVIDNQGINAFSQNIEPGFPSECREFYTLINSQNFSKDVHDTYKRFIILGRKFYKILLEPCLEFTDKKNLTIIPDGPISYLPFSALLTEDADLEYINYRDLPYFIRKKSIGYSHSSTLLFNKRLKTKSTEKKVLAFAPQYIDPTDLNDTALIRQAINDDKYLLPLRGTIKEVQSINETVPSKVFLNEKATESNFKKHASDYNVLHLAMHTIMKDDNPLQSLLAFTTVENADTIEDNKLYAYEIYNLKLNAQMAVLSSCSSGFGKMHKGEGMMSLARGFMYAGCPSIVMTLWQVADQSSSELMRSFYKYLKKGKSKQEAMRLAKIKYLETADDITSNPYFWSGFVVVGDSSPIYKKSGIVYWALLISLFVGVLVIFQYRRS